MMWTAALVVAAGLGALLSVHSGPPVYEGKPMQYWLRQRAAYGPDLPKTFVVARQAGAEAVPVLVSALETRDNLAKQAWRSVWSKLPAFARKSLGPPAEPGRLRRAAAQMLGEMGTNAVAAVRALKQALNDPDARVRTAADTALIMIEARLTRPLPAESPGWGLSLEPARRRETNAPTLWSGNRSSRTLISTVAPGAGRSPLTNPATGKTFHSSP